MSSTSSLVEDERNDATKLWFAMNGPGQHTSDSRLAEVEGLLVTGYNPNENWDCATWNLQHVYTGGCVLPFYHGGELENLTNPLASAVLSGNYDMVKLLLRFKANTEFHTEAGLTSLHLAVLSNDLKMVELLYDSGADIEARVRDDKHQGTITGFTALHLAVVSSNLEMTNLLLSRGADVHAETSAGWTSCAMAVLGRHLQVVATLLDHSLSVIDSSLLQKGNLIEATATLKPPQDEQANTEMSTAARDLINKGIAASSLSCRLQLNRCISEALALVTSDQYTDRYMERGSLTVQKVEELLLVAAGIDEIVSWPRNFCLQCQDFQLKAGQPDFEWFEHSPDLSALKNSSEGGCPLCQMFATVITLSKTPGPSYPKGPSKDSALVCLRVAFYASSGGTINISCQGMHGSLKFDVVDERMNAAICTTNPSKQSGSSFQGGLMLAKTCLESCDSKHTCQAQELPQLPTRVVYVGDEQTSPALYCSSGKHERYAALSYYWSDDNDCKTTSQNIDSHISGIAFESLPKTFQDAIIITRGLDIKYLWINALCVIQDSHDDFVTETAHTGDVYAQATVTIAAKDSGSCTDGCLPKISHPCLTMLPLDIRFTRPCGIFGNSYQPQPLAFKWMAIPPLYSPWLSEKSSVLESHGWALQEDLLSPRVLSCRDEALVWFCLERACYEGDDNSTVYRNKRATSIKSVLAKQVDSWGFPVDGQKLLEFWFDTVGEFSRRSLSQPNDKLRALAALQNRFSVLLNDTPFMGMWRSQCFLRSLLWTRGAKPTPKSSVPEHISLQAQVPVVGLSHCPSWSWASVDGAVTYSEFILMDPVPELELLSWDLSIVEPNIDARGSIVLCSDLFHIEEVTLCEQSQKSLYWLEEDHIPVDVLGEIYKAWKEGGEAKADEVRNAWQKRKALAAAESLAASQKPTVQIAIFKDFDFATDSRNISFLFLYSIPYEPPPEYGYPVYPEGRPPRAILMCLEKISDEEPHFRRVGLAEATNPQDWRHCARKETIRLF